MVYANHAQSTTNPGIQDCVLIVGFFGYWCYSASSSTERKGACGCVKRGAGQQKAGKKAEQTGEAGLIGRGVCVLVAIGA